jgi:hypothetical protein
LFWNTTPILLRRETNAAAGPASMPLSPAAHVATDLLDRAAVSLELRRFA